MGSSRADLLFPLLFPPSLISVTPNTGSTAGGTVVDLAGVHFQPGATVTFDGIPATGVVFVSSSHITATTPAHAAGQVTVAVTNPDSQASSLANGYEYAVPAIIVAVSSSSAIYSSDGINWNVGSGMPAGINSVVYAQSLGVFVAVGGGGFAATSPDGNVWTPVVVPTRAGIISFAWSNPLGLMIAPSSQLQAGLDSSDASTWNDNSLRGATGGYTAIEWSDAFALFLATASGFGGFTLRSSNGLDGLANWPAQSPLPGDFPSMGGVVRIAAGATAAILASDTGTNRGGRTTDGMTWATMPAPGFPADNYGGCAYGNERFVAISNSGAGAQVSTDDGATWSAGSLAAGAWGDLFFSPALGIFIAVGNAGAGSKIAVSSDGLTWTLSGASADFAKLSIVGSA
jgi:hypothetical protein